MLALFLCWVVGDCALLGQHPDGSGHYLALGLVRRWGLRYNVTSLNHFSFSFWWWFEVRAGGV